MCHLTLTNKSAMLGTICAELAATLCEAIFFCRGFSPLSHTLTYAYVHIPADKKPTHQSVTPSTGIGLLLRVFCKFRHAVGFLCSNMSWVITAVLALVKYNTLHYKPCHFCEWRDCGDAKTVTDLVLDSPCEPTSAQAPSWIKAKGRMRLHREAKLFLKKLLMGPQSSGTPNHIAVKPA